MDFTLTDDQELLRDTARNMLAKECPPKVLRGHMDDPSTSDALWEHLRSYTALGGGATTDLMLFLFETGYVAAPGPFLATTALFAPLLAALDHDLLADVQHGNATGTLAIAGRDGVWQANDDTTKSFVLEADRVDHIAIVTPGPSVRVVPRDAVAMRFVETLDKSRRVFEVDVAEAAGDALPITSDALRRVLDIATVSIAAR